jgi:hypothetical protein
MKSGITLQLLCEPRRVGNYSLYFLLYGSRISISWLLSREKISQAGFEYIEETKKRSSIENSKITYVHNPSNSEVLIENDYELPSVKIQGDRREDAHNALAELIRPYGFNLKEIGNR